jgi:hypothetical protein
MNKSQALDLLGGSVTAAASAIGITPQAVTQWPEELPPRIADRVYAALARKQAPDTAKRRKPTPATAAA